MTNRSSSTKLKTNPAKERLSGYADQNWYATSGLRQQTRSSSGRSASRRPNRRLKRRKNTKQAYTNSAVPMHEAHFSPTFIPNRAMRGEASAGNPHALLN